MNLLDDVFEWINNLTKKKYREKRQTSQIGYLLMFFRRRERKKCFFPTGTELNRILDGFWHVTMQDEKKNSNGKEHKKKKKT